MSSHYPTPAHEAPMNPEIEKLRETEADLLRRIQNLRAEAHPIRAALLTAPTKIALDAAAVAHEASEEMAAWRKIDDEIGKLMLAHRDARFARHKVEDSMRPDDSDDSDDSDDTTVEE